MSACRLRKAQCDACGYTVRVTRSWLEVGLPTCPCGGTIEPVDAADRAYAGLLDYGDVPRPEWTRICRENGWDDLIIRTGKAAKDYERSVAESGGFLGRGTRKAMCEYAGCGKWVKDGRTRCDTHDKAVELIPF